MFKIFIFTVIISVFISGCTSSTGKEKSETEGSTQIKVLAVVNPLTKDLEEIPYIQDVSKNTGVDVVWTQVRSGWDEQKNPLLSGGDLPDVFLSAMDDNDIATYESLFLPLNDLIEEHAPNISKMFSEIPDIKELATTADGKIYGLPAVIPHRPASVTVPMINKTWLDKLGLEAPTTFDELYDVLKAFKEKDPNGNGVADEVPLDVDGMGQWGTMGFIGAYGNYSPSLHDFFNSAKDGKFIFIPATEDYKQLLTFMNRLYKDELLNQEIITQDWSQFNSRSQDPENPLVGVTFGWSLDQRVGKWEDQYDVLLPTAANESISPLWMADPIPLKSQTNRAVISKNTKNPEAAIKWLDGFYTEEISAQGYYGSFGVGVEEKGGQYVVLPPQEGATEDEWKWTNALVDQGLMYISEDLDKKLVPPASMETRLAQDELLASYFPKEENILPKLKFTPEESNELSIIRNDLENLITIKWAEWIVEGGIENEWDGYVEELNKMGLERYKEIHQGAYDKLK